jgi:cation transport ATPase
LTHFIALSNATVRSISSSLLRGLALNQCRKCSFTFSDIVILFAGVFNLAAVGLAATGVLSPIGAAVTHQLSSFFVMINSLRLLRVERGGRCGVSRAFA